MAGLVLQCVAAGTLRTKRDQLDLLQSTFAWSVPGHRCRLYAAMEGALKHLYTKDLIETTYGSAGEGGQGPQPVWGPTPAGAAAHRSALPLHHAVLLHQDLFDTVKQGVYLTSASTGASFGRLHLLFLCLPRGDGGKGTGAGAGAGVGAGGASGAGAGRNPFSSLVWATWHKVLISQRNSALREVGKLLGVRVAFVEKMINTGGSALAGSPAAEERERHGRLAAAAALDAVLEGHGLMDVAQGWGGVAVKSLGVGQLQQLQASTAATAAMAGNLAATAGWHNIADLLGGLARELDSGVKRELSSLMAVGEGAGGGTGSYPTGASGGNSLGWVMTVSRARALYKAGLKTPGKVAEVGAGDASAPILSRIRLASIE
jgi:DNA polymerase theta